MSRNKNINRSMTPRHGYSRSRQFLDTNTTFSTQERFYEYNRLSIVKGTGENIGPGSYTINEPNKKRIKGSHAYK